MSNRALNLRVQRAIVAAISFLTLSQDDDGYWRDYQLPPGRSEAWTTACVGYALLAASQYERISDSALRRAAAALLAAQRPEGWGYNRRTACDADSTSWVIRFLARLGTLDGISATAVLSPYVTPTNRIRTFASVDRFGSWALEHDEVAPLAGLALFSAGECRQAAGIRAAVLDSWTESGWRPFWWHGRTYVCAQNLEFLLVSGGIPEDLAQTERRRLTESMTYASAFDIAQQLAAAVYLDATRDAWRLSDTLLDLQCMDGGWPPSTVLLVPDQREPSKIHVQCDDRRLLTTTVSLVALTRWIEREK
jgi:hypothetical protein